MKPETILVVEDNDTIRLGITESLQREGYAVAEFNNGIDALQHCKTNLPAIAILDLKMEPLNGIQILEQIRKDYPSVGVLMISAYGTVDDAVKAMQLGALDFLSKPFSPDELRMRVKKIFDIIRTNQKIEALTEQNRFLLDQSLSGDNEVIGISAPLGQIFALIDQIAASGSSIFIRGESGTGKEVFARLIHRKSNRANCPFIKMNCGALNENLLESELFGHEKGSFTGAIRRKKGRFELAEKGTLFLDEIGDVSAAMQVKLLRVLQEKEFERVGGEETIKADVRIIAATNRDITKMVKDGSFREDLFYRLSVIPLEVPPLRERREDIPLLIQYFLKKNAEKNNGLSKTIDHEGISLFMDYAWPGNIRELENLVERLYVITKGETIDTAVIFRHLNRQSDPVAMNDHIPLEEAVNAFEKKLILQSLEKTNGIKSHAAKLLGISASHLSYKLDKHGLL